MTEKKSNIAYEHVDQAQAFKLTLIIAIESLVFGNDSSLIL